MVRDMTFQGAPRGDPQWVVAEPLLEGDGGTKSIFLGSRGSKAEENERDSRKQEDRSPQRQSIGKQTGRPEPHRFSSSRPQQI